MKRELIVFALQFTFIGMSYSQPNLGDVCTDKTGNIYCGGYFSNLIDFGDNNTIKSAGQNDVFISKYTPEGNLTWASRFGGNHDITLSGITCDQNGNTYFTGSYDTSAQFRNFKIISPLPKIYASPNFYLAKLNASGDPVWIKSSKNTGRDDGSVVTSDMAGNIYVAGTFDNTFSCESFSITSIGSTSIFIMKIKYDGTIVWLKKLGEVGDNSCNSIYYSNSKLYLGISTIGGGKLSGHFKCLQESNGEQIWDKEIGSSRGSVNGITSSQDGALLITGTIESKLNPESSELLVAKYTNTGAEVWTKQFSGGLPNGKAIYTDKIGNIFITGDFIDSLRLGKFNAGGYPKEDLFLAKLNSSGIPQYLIGTGNSKIDRGSHLHFFNNSLYLSGMFTDGLAFGKLKLNGSDNTIFLARFETTKMTCEKMNILAKEVLFGDEVKTTNIYGKLLLGAGKDKNFLTEQILHIENQNGDILKRTVTDEKGDFSFRNINMENPINLVIESNENLKESDEIYLATQTGFILDKITMKDKKFVYPIIQAAVTQLEEMEEEDVSLKFTEFGKNGGKEFMITERISYEPNSWTIPDESKPYLDKLATYMRKYSKVKLEINSHTDALGDDDFNKKLSAIRGEEVKEYLVNHKVSASRIFVNGFGEEKILNRCTKGIKCSESEHAFNRRIEFRFYQASGL